MEKQKNKQNELDRYNSNEQDRKLFLDYLNDWENGNEPSSADNDLRYSFNLQEKRLEENDLIKKVEISIEDGPIDLSKVESFFKVNDLHMISGKSKTSYLKKNTSKAIGSKKEYLNLYETIIEAPKDQEAIANMDYSCLSCGSVSKVSELIEGCPYCNTRFIMDELYPKVHNSYTIKDVPHGKNFTKELLKTMIPTGIIFAILTGIKRYPDLVNNEMSLVGYILMIIFSGVLLGVTVGYLLFAMRMFLTVFYNAAKSIPLLFGIRGGKKKINNMCKQHFPGLNYEYFEGKAISLLKCIIFSKDATDFVQYKGNLLREDYKDIVDISYLGGMGVDEVNEIDENIEIKLRIYLENTRYDGNKIFFTKDIAYMTMVHNRNNEIKKEFTISAVKCPSCGGSFNALREKNCIYCNTPYDAEIDDWVVTNLELK